MRVRELVLLAVSGALAAGCAGGGEEDAPSEPSPLRVAGLAPGSYDVEASLGEVTVPAALVLEETDTGYRGRLSLMIGQTLHLALRSTGLEDSSAVFATSSPATRATLAPSNGGLTGSLDLGGGRLASLTGQIASDPTSAEDLSLHFALEPFEAGVISEMDRGEAFPSLSTSGDELFMSSYESDFGQQTILIARRGQDGWTTPEVAPFSGRYSDRAPFVRPDDSGVLFGSTRPLPGAAEEAGVYNLWSASRDADGGWLAPEPLSSLSSDAADYQPSLARDGTLVFTSQRDGNQDLYLARWTGADWGEPEPLGPPVNTEGDEMSAFLDPEGRYIVFSSSSPREGLVGNDDLYVSHFRDGVWTEPRNLGQPINSFANEYGAFVSPDGRYLYFTSDRHPPANLYRVAMPPLDPQ